MMKKTLGLCGLALGQLPAVSLAEMARSSFTGDQNAEVAVLGINSGGNFLDSGIGGAITAASQIEEPTLWLLAALPESWVAGLVIVVALVPAGVAFWRHRRANREAAGGETDRSAAAWNVNF